MESGEERVERRVEIREWGVEWRGESGEEYILSVLFSMRII